MQPHERYLLPVRATDSVRSEVLVTVPAEPRAMVVFHSGLGIKASFYEPFAQSMAQLGYATALLDPRGLGTSSIRPGRHVDFGFRHLIEYDIPAALDAVREAVDVRPILVGGHSLGAQLFVLSASVLPADISGLVLIAAGTGWYRLWSGSLRWKLRLAHHVIPPLCRALGWFPGHLLGFGGREARSLMMDWAHCTRTGRYSLRGDCRDWEAEAARQTLPVLGLTVDGDRWAPPASMAHLLNKMPHADIEHRVISLDLDPSQRNAHFHWVRAAGPLVNALDEWAERVILPAPAPA